MSRESAELSEEQHYQQFDPDWGMPESEPLSDEELARQFDEIMAGLAQTLDLTDVDF